MDGLERESSHDGSEVLTMENLERHNPPKEDLANKSTFLTDDKLQSIMNFLDEVQVADRLSNVDQVEYKLKATGYSPKRLVFQYPPQKSVLCLIHIYHKVTPDDVYYAENKLCN